MWDYDEATHPLNPNRSPGVDPLSLALPLSATKFVNAGRTASRPTPEGKGGIYRYDTTGFDICQQDVKMNFNMAQISPLIYKHICANVGL